MHTHMCIHARTVMFLLFLPLRTYICSCSSGFTLQLICRHNYCHARRIRKFLFNKVLQHTCPTIQTVGFACFTSLVALVALLDLLAMHALLALLALLALFTSAFLLALICLLALSALHALSALLSLTDFLALLIYFECTFRQCLHLRYCSLDSSVWQAHLEELRTT